MGTVVIVGNAEIKQDWSEHVDSSDFVIRFNEAKNYNKNNGTKADALCLTNLCDPGRQFAKYKTVKKLPFIEEINQIWFPRPSNYYPAQFWLKPFSREAFGQANYKKHIIARNGLGSKKIVSFSKELNKKACEELSIPPKSNILMPSTGYLALKYVLQQFNYLETKIFLLGFSFEGTQYHLWENERSEVMKLHKLNMINLIS